MNKIFLEDVLRAAGDILINGYGKITQISGKHDQSNIVTESDFKSEEAIRSLVKSNYPDHNILGEENGFENQNSRYTWIIDPLDGTSNYAAQIPWFGVLVALLKDDSPILAGAYLPISDEMYLAEKGLGATKNGRPIHVSTERKLKNLLCCYSLDFSEEIIKTEKEVQIIKRLVQRCRNLRSTNSLVDFCMVADGRLGAAINQTMKIWDIAAPQLILEEAGAKVTDINGKPIRYNPSDHSDTENFTAIAASPEIHKLIMELV